MPLLSIIIPVYNVEKYIERCINSILSQSFTDFELIIVNDGSTDNSGLICDEFKKNDKRISVIHQQNRGLSIARNEGIRISCGKYLSFVDSDDFLSTNAYEEIINAMENYDLDILVGNAYCYMDENNIKPLLRKRNFNNIIYTGEEFLCKSLENESMLMPVWQFILKRDLLTENNISFEKGIYHEDELWTPKVFLCAKRVKYTEKYFYMYCQRQGSIVKSSNYVVRALDIIKICYKLEDIYINLSNKEHKKILLDNLVILYLNAFYIGKLINHPIIKKAFVVGKARKIKTKLKVILFIINEKLYYNINKISKSF